MSTFGDHTPEQTLLEWVEYVKDEYDLTLVQMVRVVVTVLDHLMDMIMWEIRNADHSAD